MFNKLEKRVNDYYITSRLPFEKNIDLSVEDVELCLKFAYDMTFGSKGEHRNHRSGGRMIRRNGEIFIDTFQGKLAEYAFYNYFKMKNRIISAPDMNTMGLTEWDGCDFELDGKQVAIKSTKHFGNLLLLETKDWDSQGRYKPNYGTGHDAYDCFVLIRIKPDGTSIMKKNRWLYSDSVSFDEIKSAIFNESWECNIAGFVSREELIYVINNGYILPQRALLNGKTPMDAENYYVQLGDMHNISEL